MIYTIFIVPVIIIVTGYLMYKYPPKKINPFIGYRTKKSMSNELAWKKANQYCGKLWIYLGALMTIISLILSCLKIITLTENIIVIITFIQIGIILIFIPVVENKIKNCK